MRRTKGDQHQRLGAIYLSHKMYREAIAAYQQAIRLNPQNGYLYTQLAAAYKIQGKNDDAASVYIDGLLRVGLAESQREPIWEAMLEIYEGALTIKHCKTNLLRTTSKTASTPTPEP